MKVVLKSRADGAGVPIFAGVKHSKCGRSAQTGARVQISSSPPLKNRTQNDLGAVFAVLMLSFQIFLHHRIKLLGNTGELLVQIQCLGAL